MARSWRLPITNPNNMTKDLMKHLNREKSLQRAIELYNKNPTIFLALKGLRKKLSLRATVEYVKKQDPKAKISVTNVMKWKNQCEDLVTNNQLFGDFMKAVGIDKEDSKNADDRMNAKEKRKTQKEKDTKLKEEMDKARVILSDMNEQNIPETKKWDMITRWRRQLDSINKEIQAGWVPKTEWITELYNINWKILSKWKEIILDKIWELDITQMSELKALSDVLDTAFKQNRLINWESTDNVAIWVNEIYDKIISNANQQKNVNRNPTITIPKDKNETWL